MTSRLLALLLLALAPLRAEEGPAIPDPVPGGPLPEFRIDPGDVARAAARAGDGGRGVLEVRLIGAASIAFATFTGDHLGRKVRIVVAGSPVSEPVVHAVIADPRLEISYPSVKEAQAAAKALAAKPSGPAPALPAAPPPANPA